MKYVNQQQRQRLSGFLYQVGSFGPTYKNFGVIRVNKTAAEPSKSKYEKKEKTWDLLRVFKL